MDLRLAAALVVPLISTAITTNKIIAGAVVLCILVAAAAWWMSRRGGKPRAYPGAGRRPRHRLLTCAGNAGRQPALASPRLPEALGGANHQRDRRRDHGPRPAHARDPAVPYERRGHRAAGGDATASLPGP